MKPHVTAFSPASGPAGTKLTITGSGFAGTTSVTFTGVPASFTVVSSTQITATVPSGATNADVIQYGIICTIVITTAQAGTSEDPV